jgi:hypothetical protein
MKLLILITISIASLNVFAANEVGENQKSECPYANQGKREAKPVVAVETEVKKEDATNISK